MLYVNDFCLLYKEISQDTDLPIVKIVSLDPIACTIVDRSGTERTIQCSDLIKLDKTYYDQLWDEIVTLEKQIVFLTNCFRKPEDFAIHKGLVIKQVDKNKVVTLRDPDVEIELSVRNASPLDQSRLNQLGERLLKYEESHEFLIEALDFLN